jgi:hypothetical protein
LTTLGKREDAQSQRLKEKREKKCIGKTNPGSPLFEDFTEGEPYTRGIAGEK